jgi:GWxTD domain-containing protein
MLRFILTTAVAAAVLTPAAPLHAQDALAIRAVRYYRSEGGRTLVKTFVQVPYTLLQPSGSGADARMAYSISARVLDASGMSLLPEPMVWQGGAAASMKAANASSLEQMEFAIAPGTYRVEVTVEDSVSGQKSQASAEVQGYPAIPPASDLLLSPAMRVADANDTVPRSGEMRVGSTLLVPATVLKLTPLRPKVFYFLEAYTSSAQEQAGTMQVAVLGSNGASITETSPAPVRVPPGGGMLTGQLDLDGLPEGTYTLQVKVNLEGRTTERSAGFEMAGLDETLTADTAVLAVARETDEGYFAAMNEAELDSAAAPLVLIAKSRELNTYQSLSPAAKRRFLAEFWKARDTSPETQRNEERERFYGAIAYANRQYRVGRGKQELGWQTDRGRVYTRHGAPDDILRRVPTGQAPPYEVWRYTRGRPRYYVFADRTGIGAYNLIQTNDLQETGIPTWREILTEDAVRDVGLFLGVDFYGGSGR